MRCRMLFKLHADFGVWRVDRHAIIEISNWLILIVPYAFKCTTNSVFSVKRLYRWKKHHPRACRLFGCFFLVLLPVLRVLKLIIFFLPKNSTRQSIDISSSYLFFSFTQRILIHEEVIYSLKIGVKLEFLHLFE